MLPVLYKRDETNFNHNGLGVMADCLSAVATEELNGKCELKIVYDIDGPLADVIDNELIIKAKMNDKQDNQLFRIYSVEKDQEDSSITINAQHITYDLGNNFVERLEANSMTRDGVMRAIQNSLAYPTRFELTGDGLTTSSTKLYRNNPLQMIAGVDGSVLDNWGGEILRDNFHLAILAKRGADDGVLVAYKKNLTGIHVKFDLSSVVTRIFPFKQDTDGNLITLSEKYIDSPRINDYSFVRIVPVDYSNNESVTDEASLRSASGNYFNDGTHKDLPNVSLEINFESLWNTEEYKDLAVLERVGIGDMITVKNSEMGYFGKSEVISIEFDVIAEENLTVKTGNSQIKFTQTVNGAMDAVNIAQQAQAAAGQAITQANGKNKTYYSATEPTGTLIEGDLWYQIINGQYTRMYRYDGLQWQLILSADANDAANKADDALEAANGKNKNYYSAAQPTGAQENDRWFRDNADGTVTQFIYQGGQWINPVDDGVKDAQDQASDAVSRADAATAQATSAAQDAINAVNTSNSASTAAQAAQQTAGDAASQASAAWDNAQAAMADALNAINTANDASDTAQSAQADANTAINQAASAAQDAQDALDGVSSLNGQVDAMQSDIAGKADATWVNGQLVTKADKETTYTKTETDNALSGKVSTTTYNTDQSGIVQRFENNESSINQNAEDIQTKVSSTTYNADKDTLTQNIASVDQKADGIRTDVNSLTQTVSDQGDTITNQGTSINQLSDSVALKASQSTVDTLTGRVSTAESTLTTQANQIAARITEADADSRYATQTALTATSSSLTSQISSVQTDFNNLQIGTRNLWRQEIGFDWNPGGMVYSTENVDGVECWKIENTNGASQRGVISRFYQKLGLVDGHTYTIKFYYKGDAYSYSITGLLSDTGLTEGGAQFSVATVTATAYYPGYGDLSINIRAGGVFYMSKEALVVEGNKATDWSPAPEDMATAAQFTSLSQTLEGFQTTVQQDYATKSLVTQTASALQSSIDAKVDSNVYNSKISQLSNDINLRVSKNDVVNQINVSTESILIAGNKVHITGQTTIDNAVITSAMIAAVDAGKITTGYLNTNRLAAKSVTVDKLDVANLAAISANLGSVTSGTMTSVVVNSATINGGNINGSVITGYGTGYDQQQETVRIGQSAQNYPIEIYGYGTGRIASDEILLRTLDSNTEMKMNLNQGFLVTYVNPSNTAQNRRITISKDVIYIRTGADDSHLVSQIQLAADGTLWATGNMKTNNDMQAATMHTATLYSSSTANLNYVQTGGLTATGDSVFNHDLTVKNNLNVTGTASAGASNISGTATSNYVQTNYVNSTGDVKTTASMIATVYKSQGDVLFLGVGSSEMRVVSSADGTVYKDARALHWYTPSLLEYKQDISAVDENAALSLIKSVDICKFRFKSDVADGKDKTTYGPIIGDGYNLPSEFLDATGEGTDDHSALYLNMAATKSLTKMYQELLIKNAELESRISQLEGAA